jgi:hypothetical protein
MERAIDPRIPKNFDLLLQHCNQQIQMITQCSGDVFYIGICCSPYTRWAGRHSDFPEESYKGHQHSWGEMHILCCTTGAGAANLEKAVLRQWRSHQRCRNKVNSCVVQQKPFGENILLKTTSVSALTFQVIFFDMF